MSRRSSVFLLTILAVGVASAQWIEGHITLPDSLGGAGYCNCLAYSATFNTVYVGSEATGSGGMVHAIDLSTNRVVARVRFSAAPRDLCLDEVNGKLYCAPGGAWTAGDSMLSVIDCATNGVVAEIPVGARPRALALDPARHKLYCSVRNVQEPDSVVRVICTSGDTLLGSVKLEHEPGVLFLDTATSKLYCGRDSRISVVDTRADTVVTVLGVGRFVTGFCLAPEVGKVYCCAGWSVWAIDRYSDSVLGGARVFMVSDICYDPGVRRVYAVSSSHQAVVIDATTDSIIKRFRLHSSSETPAKLAVALPGLSKVAMLFFDSHDITGTACIVDCGLDTIVAKVQIGTMPTAAVGVDSLGLVFCVGQGGNLSIVDVAIESLTGVVYLGARLFRLNYSPAADKLYALHVGTLGAIHAFDARTCSHLATIRTGHTPRRVCPVDSWAKLYCVNSMERSVSVVDLAGDTALAKLTVQPGPSFLAAYEPLGRLYVGSSSRSLVYVVSCTEDSVIGTIDVGGGQVGLLVAEDMAKLYVQVGLNRNVLAIVDCRSDSIVAEIPVSGAPIQYSPTSRRVYVGSGGRTVQVIDADGDSLLGTLEIPGAGRGQLAWVPWTDEVLVSDDGDNYVQIIDCARGAVTDRIDMYGHTEEMYPVVFSEKVYCASPEGVKVIDVAARRMVEEFSSVQAEYFAESPAHRRVFAGSGGASFLTVFRDSLVPAVGEEWAGEDGRGTPPTFIRGVLPLSGRQSADLLDIAGRRIMDLQPGPNDIRHLAPGVYFVRSAEGGERPAVRKVVIQR